MSFCCENMKYYLDEDKELCFNSISRSYYLRLKQDLNATLQELYYCPWCGNKLPNSLNKEWLKILREEYNLLDPIFDDADKVPEEFKTDEWWKKRGL